MSIGDIANIQINGVPTTVWGPILWSSMHILANAYPSNPSDEHKQAAKAFYESLVYLLPCSICQRHYQATIKEHPIDDALVSKEELDTWVFRIHNIVNLQLKKEERTMDQYKDELKKLGLLQELSIGKLHIVYWNGTNWMEVYK